MSCRLMYELYYESKQLSSDELEANPCSALSASLVRPSPLARSALGSLCLESLLPLSILSPCNHLQQTRQHPAALKLVSPTHTSASRGLDLASVRFLAAVAQLFLELTSSHNNSVPINFGLHQSCHTKGGGELLALRCQRAGERVVEVFKRCRRWGAAYSRWNIESSYNNSPLLPPCHSSRYSSWGWTMRARRPS